MFSNIIPNIGYQDFTIRFKIKIEKFGRENHIIIIDSDIDISSYFCISINLNDGNSNNGKISVQLWKDGTFPRILKTTYALKVNVIYEICLSRKNNTFYLFLNGSLIGSFDLSLYLADAVSCMSREPYHALTGYISDISINIGKALYTSNYTVTNDQFLENTYGKVFNSNSTLYSI